MIVTENESLTETVIASMGQNVDPRTREILSSLIRHLHAFVREVNLTTGEWMTGVEMLNRAGKMTDEKRNEMILVCDVLGIESLVDSLNNRKQGNETESAILGPFYRDGAELLPVDATTQKQQGVGEAVRVSGKVIAPDGAPISNAVLDIWEDAPNGLYESQDANQPDMNLRGRFKTDQSGRYALRCIRPVSYPVPYDGPAGEILIAMDRHPYRPAHLHLIVSAPGYQTLVTQIFDKEDKYLESDSVFAVKDSLIVEFRPTAAGSDVQYVVEHDICLTVADRDAAAISGAK